MPGLGAWHSGYRGRGLGQVGADEAPRAVEAAGGSQAGGTMSLAAGQSLQWLPTARTVSLPSQPGPPTSLIPLHT